jgi:outer membrane protein assembly factor BamB
MDATERWATDIGHDGGHAAATDGDRVYVTGGGDGSTEILALDAATGVERWSSTVPGTAVIESTAAGRVHCTSGPELVSLDASTGAERLHAHLGDDVSSVHVADGDTYVYTADWSADRYEFLALDDDGDRRWGIGHDSYLTFLGRVGRNVLVHSYGEVHCVNALNGSVAWTLSVEGGKDPVLVDGTLYTHAPDGNAILQAVDPRSGQVRRSFEADCRWLYDTQHVVGDRIVMSGSPVDGEHAALAFDTVAESFVWTHAVDYDAIVNVGRDRADDPTDRAFLLPMERDDHGPLTAVDIDTGRRSWTYRVDERNPLVYDVPDADATVVSDADTLYGIDASTGRASWSFGVQNGGVLRPTGERLLLTDGSDLYALDAGTGEVEWRREIGSSSPEVGEDSVFYVDGTTVRALVVDPATAGAGGASGGAGDTQVFDGSRGGDDSTRVFEDDDGDTCPDCGAALKPEAAFCSQCGLDLSTVGGCPDCGADVDPDDLFCSQCGAGL